MATTRALARQLGWVAGLWLAFACAAQAAGPFAFGWNPRTGTPAMDARLSDINQYGDRYREAFLDELVRYHAAPRTLSRALLADERWAPGDLYYACALAGVVGRPCRYLIERWRAGHASGWEATSTQLGVPPGSAGFQRVAAGIEASYARWGRPLPVVQAPQAAEATPADPSPDPGNGGA